MPRAIDKAINHPEFNNFVYNALKGIRPEVKSKLPEKYLKVFKNDTILRAYCHKASLDKQVEVLSYLGIDMWIIFSPNPHIPALATMASSIQYENQDFRLELIEAMAREKVFVLGSREITMKLHITSQNPSTRAYGLSNNSVAITKMYADVIKGERHNNKTNRTTEADKWLARVELAILNSEPHLEGVINVDKLEMRILTALFLNQNTAVDMPKLLELLGMQRGSIIKCLNNLITKGYAFATDKPMKNRYYIITTEGLKKKNEFSDYVKNVSLQDN